MRTNATQWTQEEILRELNRRASAQNFASFVQFTYPQYLMGWVHNEICGKLDQFLQDVREKKSPRLIITMPPRSGKSELVSRRFPAYVLGRYPDTQIIATSYSADLTKRFNRDVQRIIDDHYFHEVFPEVMLGGTPFLENTGKLAVRSSDFFEILNHKGSYRSTGVGGGITGLGADVLLIDDPVKDRSDANSLTMRNAVWDWYTSTAYTRLSRGGGVIVMATRWHMDDLIGRLLKNAESGEGDKFEIVNYPAIAEHDEPMRRQGEALHPERYPLEQLEAIRKTIGFRDWNALYQQHPVPDGGALFKEEWFKTYRPEELPNRFDQVVVSWDMTFKDSKNSDYVVGQVWGRFRAQFFLLDQVRGQWDFVRTREMFKELAMKWPEAKRKLIEDKANGSAIISELKKTVTGIIPISPKESKHERASSVTPLWEAGNVFIPESAPWLNDFKGELLGFPSAPHDDIVDACSQALNYLQASRSLKIDESNRAFIARRLAHRI